MMRYFLQFTFLITFYSCQQRNEQKEAFTSPLKRILPTSVLVQVSEEKKFEYLIYTTGKIQALHEAKLYGRSEGIVSKVLVANGDRVRTGQIIAELENQQQLINLEKAKAALDEKKVSFEDQMLSIRTYQDSSIRKQQMNNVRFTSGLANAELNYKQALYEFEQTKIKTPISGIVSALQLKAFNPIDINHAVTIIYNPDYLLAECFISESDAILIAKGHPGEVTVPGFPPIYAIIHDIDKIVDDQAKLVRCAVLIKGRPNLFPGMRVEVLVKVPFQNPLW